MEGGWGLEGDYWWIKAGRRPDEEPRDQDPETGWHDGEGVWFDECENWNKQERKGLDILLIKLDENDTQSLSWFWLLKNTVEIYKFLKNQATVSLLIDFGNSSWQNNSCSGAFDRISRWSLHPAP